MAIIRWEPFSGLENLFDELRTTPLPSLATDLYEEDGAIVVEVDTAGVDPATIDITVEGENLRITGTRVQQKEQKKRNYYIREIQSGSFECRLSRKETALRPVHIYVNLRE